MIEECQELQRVNAVLENKGAKVVRKAKNKSNYEMLLSWNNSTRAASILHNEENQLIIGA